MREIKFRAWDKGKNKMIDDTDWSWFSDVYMPDMESERHILMQFTGLKDKNGKEIYEGDLVKVGEIIWHICWYERSSAFWLLSVAPVNKDGVYIASSGSPARDWNWMDCGEAVYWHQSRETNKVEVIGNIYENPELIK